MNFDVNHKRFILNDARETVWLRYVYEHVYESYWVNGYRKYVMGA
jgi:hypothetical protein